MDSKKGREIIVNLTDEDAYALCKKAGTVGLTVPELIESFILDLIDGTGSNGSDERECANMWLERCWFGFEGFQTFLGFLFERGLFEDMLREREILNYLQSLEELEEREINDIRTSEKELNEMYREYRVSISDHDMEPVDADLDAGLARIDAWNKEKDLIMQNVPDDNEEEEV